ncbi:sulfite exporter TauE/SafE family protein [Herbidospora cretacea]|uniref:sulfite exporter TauE/SafE family protein n=1 Tax=Herbidospora cretacea TaxID=28444 RepID=UPI000A40C222|nr:sulfite exporter TauE/SafE family protein [Herbidospora cretacea]
MLLFAIVIMGAAVQRLAGAGFALVAVPALVLLLGAAEGVRLANGAALVISAAGLALTWRSVRPAAMLPLVAAAAAAVPAGAWFARTLPEPALLSVTGVLVSAAALLVMGGVRVRSLRGRRGALAAGAASGFLNAAAGVGGPAISLYAVNAGWTVRQFVPHAQFYGVVVNALSLAAKGLPRLTGPTWALVGAGIAAGLVIGAVLASRVPEGPARRIVLALALAGGLTTLAKGLWS